MLWKKISLEQPTVPVSGVSRYLTPLWVSGNEEPQDGPCQSDSSSSQSIITDTGFQLQKMNLFPYHQVSVSCKIRAALKLLTFREQHVIVQFWSPREVGKHQLLTTIDQPFGVGVASEALCFYRRDSEHNFCFVDKDHEEEDLSPPARVFRRGLPEWTPDLNNYKTKDFLQLDCAIRCGLHGYLALPVFDSYTGLCVGVLELLTSVKDTSYAFEVQQVHKAFKAEHLSSPEVFDHPFPKALYECKQTELDKIFGILKNVCDYHNLPLAQAWTVSPSSSFVSNNKVIEKTCSSFDTRCIGKACMSSANLPFHVRDTGMWRFRKACQEQHLDKHSAFVGKALLARGSCYVENVSELSEDEYPLAHNARMSGLTRCFTVYLHSVERDDGDNDEYVLEFFLQLDDKDIRHVQDLVQTLKQIVDSASGLELGEISPVEVTEPPGDASCLSLGVQLKQTRKRKIDSLSVDTVKQHFGKSLGQTAQIFGVSRSLMTRFCQKHGIRWPVPNHRRKNNFIFDPKLSQRSSSPSFGSAIGVIVYVVLKVKRWSCSTKNHGFSGKWWSCGKHSYLPFHDSSLVDASSSWQGLGHCLDTELLTVKASFKDDMAKFRFPVSERFAELENEVVQRINVKGKRVSLNYEDEDKDMLLVTCDADLQFMARNTTVKFIVEAYD